MTSDEMELAIEFLLNSQAKSTANINVLARVVNELTGDISQLKQIQNQILIQMGENQNQILIQMETDRQETREAIDNLIIANEVTRDLAQNVAKLAITTSQRVTALENR